MTEVPRNDQDWRLRVFDALAVPVLVLRPDKQIVAANREFRRHFGVRAEELTGTTCQALFDERLSEPELPCRLGKECPLAATLRTRKPSSVVRRVPGDDGTERYEDRLFSPILDDRGEVVYVLESIRDITRAKLLEQAYSGMRRFVDRVIQSSPSAIVAADRKGRVILMNQAAQELFGYRFKGAPPLNIEDLYPKGTARAIMRELRRGRGARRPGQIAPVRLDIMTATGERVPVEMSAAIVYEDDQEIATMGIYNDLREKLASEEKLAEARAQVLQSEKLASLGRLAAGVAHEINNPLTGIALYAGLLREDVDADDPQAASLDNILEDTARCQKIVKNLLAYSRQASPGRQTFSLTRCVEESLGLIRDQKMFFQVEIHKVFSSEDLWIRGDRKQLDQVVINLIMNALDAMDHQGTLTLRTGVSADGSSGFLEVEDTGTGISPELMQKVFEPFFTTKEFGKGTGLGLSTAYGIVSEHGGTLRVERTSESGTTFRMELPLAPAGEIDAPETIG